MSLRVAQVTTGLETGGAEMLLLELVDRLDEHDVTGPVISLRHERGALAGEIEATGTQVVELAMGSPPSPADLLRLRRAIAAAEADVVQTWLLHANVIAGLLAPRDQRLVWGVHMSEARAETHGRLTIALQRLEGRLSSRVPERIVASSQSSLEEMILGGYDSSRIDLIPNGFDTRRFAPDPARGAEVRASLGIPADAPLVGHFARYHPMKDHRNLLAAVPVVLERVPEARFILCGDGVEPSNPELAALANGLDPAVSLLGRRDDVASILCGVDVSVSSSTSGEAMPVVIGEAMATGVPFVATDVADAAEVIADTGRIVPAEDPLALGLAITDLLEMPAEARRRLGMAARERIVERYPADGMVAGYVDLWRRVAAGPR
jgi:glycosyltransferase involved in cell wall biosynthesis